MLILREMTKDEMKLSNLYNPLVTFILRSPLHKLMSKSVVLVQVTGCKSGRQYTIPANYARENGSLTLITSRQHNWWRNLKGGAPVKVRVAGEERCGTARIVPADLEARRAAMQAVYPGITAKALDRFAPESAVVRIELDKPESATK